MMFQTHPAEPETPPMTTPLDAPQNQSRPWIWPLLIASTLGLVAIAIVLTAGLGTPLATASAKPVELPIAQEPKPEPKPEANPMAPEFPEKMDWLNTAGPITMKDLKGKIVLLDFWTLCCINCIHTLPDLAKLEKKYANEIVVIGVHSAKFDNEKETQSIRKAVLRYEIAHPVVNDADHKIWDKYGVSSWPTLMVVDSEGKVVGAVNGEGNFDLLDKVIGKLIEDGKKKKTLNETPIRFDLVRFREKGDTPLFFPGKVLADEAGKRLFIADSTHHRVVITDLDGKKLGIIGSGSPGFKDGKFADAQFDDPQGLALDGDLLYIADRKNHSIRAANLKTGEVKIFAGTGQQDSRSRFTDTPADPLKTGLNSPWDLLMVDRTLFIAMAGHHQLWAYDLKANKIQVYAGDGRENVKDGPLYASNFAQPSGLTTDGKFLYVADSEVSAIRKLSTDGNGRVETLIGEGLFEFGDKDGTGKEVRIQHALGVMAHEGKIIIADTYNNKLKLLDPKTLECKTLAVVGEIGNKEPLFNEPAGMTIAAGKLYVADTNAHRIRVVDLKSLKVATLALTGVEPPPPQKDWQPKK
jgi:thiol-disulfide isomerase/thioredoxin